MTKLLPCPFCGEQPKEPYKSGTSDERTGYNFIVNVSCKCGANISRSSQEDKNGWCNDTGQALDSVTKAWNRRQHED